MTTRQTRHRLYATASATTVVAVGVALGFLATRTDEPPDTPTTTTGLTTTTFRAPPEQQGTPSTTRPSLPNTPAGDIVAELEPDLPLDRQASYDCLTDALEQHPELIDQLDRQIDRTSPEYQQVIQLATDCHTTTTYPPILAQDIGTQYGATPQQQACLTEAFTELTPQDIEQILASNPRQPEPPPAIQKLHQLAATCNVDIPI